MIACMLCNVCTTEDRKPSIAFAFSFICHQTAARRKFAGDRLTVSGSMHALIAALLLASLAACAGYLFFLRQQKQFTGNLGPRKTSPTRGNPGDDIVVTGFFTPVGKLAGSVSPFTSKIETYLRFADLPFKTENGGFAGSPKGRVCSCTCFFTDAL